MRQEDKHWLGGDSILAIVAGSDTVTATLNNLFYYMASYPQHAERLYEEISSLESLDIKSLQRLPHMTAMIDETLRLNPALPTGGQRQSPPEGLQVAGWHIPGDVTIVAPKYVIGRCKFVHCDVSS